MFTLGFRVRPKLSKLIYAQRAFSYYLEVPTVKDLTNLEDTYAYTEKYQKQFEEYNAKANAEYDTMIMNRTNNIVNSGNVSDWEIVENNSFMTKTFEFAIPEHSLYFVNQVSRWCTRHDHHPEWSMKDDNSVEVFLTSHFADNKVTVTDYELAQEMNLIYKKAVKYNPYTFFTPERLIEMGKLF